MADTLPAVAAVRPAVPRPPRARDPFFDNAKFLAILLVPVIHAISPVKDVPLARGAYLFISMFVMPLFIVITGYLSRNFTFSGGKARKLIINIGVPYVVFEITYSVLITRLTDKPMQISLLDPRYLTWFLIALFLWRLSTPVWQQIRWPLGVAVAISLLSYMGQLPAELDMHRVFGLVPFYVLGLLLKPEHFELLKTRPARIVGALTLLGGLLFAMTVGRLMNVKWVLWNAGHDVFGVDNISGTLMRFAMLVAATVLVAAFLTMVPARHTWFTKLGTATLYAYLLHGLVTQSMLHLGMYEQAWTHTVPGVLALIAGALVLGTVLCTKPVVKTMHWALEPQLRWAFTPLRNPNAKSAPTPRRPAD